MEEKLKAKFNEMLNDNMILWWGEKEVVFTRSVDGFQGYVFRGFRLTQCGGRWWEASCATLWHISRGENAQEALSKMRAEILRGARTMQAIVDFKD